MFGRDCLHLANFVISPRVEYQDLTYPIYSLFPYICTSNRYKLAPLGKSERGNYEWTAPHYKEMIFVEK